MAKLKQENIMIDDISEYIKDYSDFAFELKVLDKFLKNNFICEHGGTYEDPVSNKIRQFDLRAKKISDGYAIMLAIECKNIRHNFPIVANCVKRNSSESFHQIINSTPTGPVSVPQPSPWVECSSFYGEQSIYKQDEYVAKSLDQVGRHFSDNTIINSDDIIFSKMTQSVSSAYELLKICRDKGISGDVNSFVMPILIIPDNTLWKISYDNGIHNDNIENVKRISYYIDRSGDVSTHIESIYRISHMEILTYSYIDEFVKEYFEDNNYLRKIFNKSI